MPQPQIESLVSVCHHISGNVQRARRQADGAALLCGRNDRAASSSAASTHPAAILISDSTAYQRVGWLAKKAKPVKAQPMPRKTLERRLQKLESEAAGLREQLDSLPSGE